MEITDKLNNRV